MSFPDTKRCSASILGHVDMVEEEKCLRKGEKNIPEKPRRKMSMFESSDSSNHLKPLSTNDYLKPKVNNHLKPIKANSSSTLLDETLCGLQEVSDMLQASLKEFEESVGKTKQVKICFHSTIQ